MQEVARAKRLKDLQFAIDSHSRRDKEYEALTYRVLKALVENPL
jgi:hypothetical protein